MALALVKLFFVNNNRCKSPSTFNYKVNLIIRQINIWLMENRIKACERNINQIKFDYEKRYMDLYCSYS
jgi:hypothetical protein